MSPLDTDYRLDEDRPDWLLSDGCLLAARLQGENTALRQAVKRALQENDELATRSQQVEEANRSLEEDNYAAAQALRQCVSLPLMGAFVPPAGTITTSALAERRPSTPGLQSSVHGIQFNQQQKEAVTTSQSSMADATRTRLQVAGFREFGNLQELSNSTEESQAERERAEAGTKLLAMSRDFGRRMEDILARRGKLQALFEMETDVGSTVHSGGEP